MGKGLRFHKESPRIQPAEGARLGTSPFFTTILHGLKDCSACACRAELIDRYTDWCTIEFTCVDVHKLCVLTSPALKTVSTSNRNAVPGAAS